MYDAEQDKPTAAKDAASAGMLVAISASAGGVVIQTHWPQSLPLEDQRANVDLFYSLAARAQAKQDIQAAELQIAEVNLKIADHTHQCARLDAEHDERVRLLEREIGQFDEMAKRVEEQFGEQHAAEGRRGPPALRGDAKTRHMTYLAEIDSRKAASDKLKAERDVAMQQRSEFMKSASTLLELQNLRIKMATKVLEG